MIIKSPGGENVVLQNLAGNECATGPTFTVSERWNLGNVDVLLGENLLRDMNGGLDFWMHYDTNTIRHIIIMIKLYGNINISKTPHQTHVYFLEYL